MADNTQLDLGSGGDLISTDDIGGGVKVQRVKAQFGADGSATDVSTANPFPIAGPAAHDAAVSGSPVLNGAEARTTNGTAVGNGDAVRQMADTLGKLIVLPGAPNDLVTRGTANYTNTSAADVIAAAGAGVKIVVMGVMVTNFSAVATKVSIRDGTTAKITGAAAANGGGFAISGTTPLFVGTANTAVTAICSVTESDTDVNVWGYLINN